MSVYGLYAYAYVQGCSERNISCVVEQHQGARALRAAHSAFLLSHLVTKKQTVYRKEGKKEKDLPFWKRIKFL